MTARARPRARKTPGRPEGLALPPAPTLRRRDTVVLAAALALLVLARLLAELGSGAAAWGLDYARYLGPEWRFGPWIVVLAISALAALPAARAATRRALRPIATSPAATYVVAALACGTLCYALPDRTYFTGDFALRRSAVAGITSFDRLFPQAMPLDRILHLEVPRALRAWTGLPIEAIAGAFGAIEAGLFGALAAVFARRCGAPGLAAVVATATVAASAALGLFTGYDKSFAELGIVTLAFAVAGLRELSRGRPGWVSGLLVVVAVALHRSGLALVPAWLALWMWNPAPARATGPHRWPWALLIPAALVASQLPFAWRGFRAVDVRHLAPAGADQVLSSAIEPGRLLSLGNLALFLVPLALLIPVAFALSRSRREPSLRWLAWLAGSWLLLMLAIHPTQGEFRDWDVFAPGGVAIALLLAWLLARACAGVPAPLVLALATAAMVPRVQWLALQANPARSLARIEAWAAGPPALPPTVAASTLEYVGIIHFRDGRLAEGRRAMESAIAQVPMERLYLDWANAEAQTGDWPRAIELFEQAAARYPHDPTPWWMLTQAALQRNDRRAAQRGVAGWLRLAPEDSSARALEAALRGRQEPPQAR